MAWARGQKNEMTMTSISVLYELAAKDPKKVAFIKDEEIWTYDRLAAAVDHLAFGLVERGLRKGDRIALHMANLPEFVVAYHACFRTGVIAAPLNIRLKTAELIPLLQRLQPTLYIGQAALYNQVASIDSSILASNSRFVVDGPVNDPRVQPWTSLFGDVNGEPLQRTLDVDVPAVLLTTSGTTGRPKFVIHTLATLLKIAESYEHGITCPTACSERSPAPDGESNRPVVSPSAIAISTCNHSGPLSFLIIKDFLSRLKRFVLF